MTRSQNSKKICGFTLVELMIVVAIISVLAAIAAPIYTKYVKKARTSEAVTNLGAIAMFEETFFSENDSYMTAVSNPATVPSAADPGGRLLFNGSASGWDQLGNVMPDGQAVYFQYEVTAGQFDTGGTATTGGTGNLVNHSTPVFPGKKGAGAYGCTFVNASSFSAADLNIPTGNSVNWFFATAVGDQDADLACSLFIKIIDRPDVVQEDDIE